MHPRILGQRTDEAQERTLRAARKLGRKFGLTEQVEALENTWHRDPQVAALQEREAVADLLTAVASKATAAQDAAEAAVAVAEAKEAGADAQPAGETVMVPEAAAEPKAKAPRTALKDRQR